jgi:hypothetical protein
MIGLKIVFIYVGEYSQHHSKPPILPVLHFCGT